MKTRASAVALTVFLVVIITVAGCGTVDEEVSGNGQVAGTAAIEISTVSTAIMTMASTSSVVIESSATPTGEAASTPTASVVGDSTETPFATSRPEDIPGVPGIPVRFTDGTVPAFTFEDVMTYLSTREAPFRDPTKPDPIIESIEFRPAVEVAELLMTHVYRYDTHLMCLVIFKGDFVKQGPGGLESHGTRSFFLFDAQTGNRLMQGILH